MTRRWLAATALVMALAGCADEELAPAEIPVPATGAAEAPASAVPVIRAATHAAAPRAAKSKMPRWLADGRWCCRSRFSAAAASAKASTVSDLPGRPKGRASHSG
jgi:hypothetical protein